MAGKVSQSVLVVEDDANGHRTIEQLYSSIPKEASIVRRDCNSLQKGDLKSGAYDFVVYGVKSRVNTSVENNLCECLRVLKPAGRIFIHKNVEKDCIADKIVSSLKLCGFLDVKETRDVVEAIKPSFEIGSSVKLSFNKNGPSTESLKKWQLAVDEYNEGKENDLIDDNELLDEADLIKPDPESLRVCGTTGKRKACANCTCGLAEELNNAEISSLRQNTQQAKSSCGSCYLGDAFRCADCPYIGLPAFKPGEKVIIDNSSDI